jgi:hypothetical protein
MAEGGEKMPEAILEPDEAQEIAMQYVCQKEKVANADVKIESFEPSSWCGIPIYVFQGKITQQSVDSTTNPAIWQAGPLKERPFTIKITADKGKTVGYAPGDWRKSGGQGIPESKITFDPLDEELKRSEIERNLAEAEKMERDMQEEEEEASDWAAELTKKHGIDINKYRFKI